MKNIIKIIVSDIKRLSVNVVAMVVIIGLTVIPCLYAWFNILSNWDPYGENSTSHLQVAVASSDEGLIIGNIELNVGDIIISKLQDNKSIGWVFTDTAQEAIDGVYSGDYYAALVIDEEFSANMISFLSGNIEHPVITYYENEKKNAIAPKITSKVKTTIQREVDHAFVGTIAETLLKGGEYFATIDEQGNVTGRGIAKLERLDSDLKGVIALLDSYIALMDSTESISEAGEAITNTADSITALADEISKTAKSSAKDLKNDAQDLKNDTDDEVDEINKKIESYEADINSLNKTIDAITYAGAKDFAQLNANIATLKQAWGAVDDNKGLYYLLAHIKSSKLTNEAKYAILTHANAINTNIIALEADVKALEEASLKSETDFITAKDKLVKDIYACLEATSDIREKYKDVISPLNQKMIDTTSKTVKEVENLLDYEATSIDLVADSLDSYSTIMDQSKSSLIKSRNEAVDMEKQLSKVISNIKSVSDNERYKRLMDLLESDPDLLSDFISSPVEISEEYVYPVENNGSMTAPFYIVLSIWVGSLIMSTILKTTVKNTEGIQNLKNWQCFFGRYFVTFVIGQIQTMITVLGALLFVGIQCEHPFYFWLACAWTSLIYSLLLYSFTYSFGNVGEALSVVFMVIQVAGAGGTFPIEVLPKVFQNLYMFMPFKYSMNAVRECIAGFYKNTYRDCMLTLILYVILAVFVGVILYHPFKLINEKIENSKEKSGILI